MEHASTGGLEQEVYQLLSHSFIRLDTTDMYLMRRFGLTLTQSWALVYLDNSEGRSLSELASLLVCDKSNVTSIVDKLEKDGFAARKHGKAGDRRYTRVILTDAGHQLRNAVMSARAAMVRERLQTLAPQDLHRIHHALQELATLLNSQYEQGEEPQIVEHAFAHSQQSLLPGTASTF
jgi:DNA-binding MarR family transcriptional regulator